MNSYRTLFPISNMVISYQIQFINYSKNPEYELYKVNLLNAIQIEKETKARLSFHDINFKGRIADSNKINSQEEEYNYYKLLLNN